MPYVKAVPDAIVRMIRKERGMSVRVAEACGITRQVIPRWSQVPAAHVLTVARIIGKTPQQIRPDIFGHDKKGRKS